ncbi:hypothetical protein RMN57_29170 [Kitasatospora sp. CM 4170]|uniref:Uncharacterized protein n=1 Tax=Kitasatospora aburaviensis TaxID=67265 RepID=A0ABW1EN56_9ACTN|nr:hypothetical protein [Kitasatospora sp. CM 4170]WNM48465.1 hypothetical protein RMN57_29170 [Kitasatospora sp. CM 4170]
MTVLHSRNADASDAADAKAADAETATDAADTTDATDLEQTTARPAATDPDLRDELGRYAELGAFTLTAESHAWYAAVDTVATPEDARAASTVLAELRGRDLQQTWDAVTALAADVKLDEPDTVAKAALLVELLQRVHKTSTTLVGAAYDADLDALIAATADRAWRRERGVKLSFLKVRGLRKQAAAFALDGRKVRPEELHEAFSSAEIERRAWAVLAPSGTLPNPPADGALVESTATAFEAIGTGLRELARLLPAHDLDGLPFGELIDLVERLAADEGTLYRLPTIRSLRATLEEAGLADLLAELTEARADRRAAEAAFTARQALAGGQRDGLAGTRDEAEPEPETDAETDAEAEVETEPGTAEVAEAAVAVEPEPEVVAAAEPEVVAEAAVEPDAADAEPVLEADELVIEEPVAVQPLVVTLPAPSPAADDLVDVTPILPAKPEPEAQAEVQPEAEAEAAVVEVVEETTEVVPAVEAAEALEADEVEETVVEEAADEVASAEVVEAAEPEVVAAEVEETQPEVETVAEAVVEVAEPEVEVAAVEPVAEEATAEAVAEPEVEPVLESEQAEQAEQAEPEAAAAEAEATATAAVETEAEVEPVAEETTEVDTPAVETAEPVAAEAEPEVTAVEPTAEETTPETEAAPEAAPEPQSEPAAVAETVIEAAPEPQPEPAPVVEPATAVEPVPAVEPAPVVEPATAGRPEKPDFTPGRPVTAYSADELLAVVRWVDGDGVKRSDEELLRAAMKELGFARLGPRIKEALGAAVTAARG